MSDNNKNYEIIILSDCSKEYKVGLELYKEYTKDEYFNKKKEEFDEYDPRTIQELMGHKNTNMTTIDLGPCEKLLKDHYKIKDNELLYMKQIEVYQEELNIPMIQEQYIRQKKYPKKITNSKFIFLIFKIDIGQQ